MATAVSATRPADLQCEFDPETGVRATKGTVSIGILNKGEPAALYEKIEIAEFIPHPSYVNGGAQKQPGASLALSAVRCSLQAVRCSAPPNHQTMFCRRTSSSSASSAFPGCRIVPIRRHDPQAGAPVQQEARRACVLHP